MKPQKAKVQYMLEVSEIFGPTIQGEGLKIGTPSVFVRFGKCNFDCSGFGVEYTTPSGVKKFGCDSYYAVDKEFRKFWSSYENAKDLIFEVNKLIPSHYKPDIVITGGEPMLYWNNKEFQKFLEYYINLEYNITIETNGAIDVDITKAYQEKILYSISLKLANTKEPYNKRINYKSLNNIINKSKNRYLKFVVNQENQDVIQEIEEILALLPKIDVFLMPQGDTTGEIMKNSLFVIELCVKYGFKYSDRLHIRIWDNKQGV